MNHDNRFNILSADFDPSLLLNESYNVPLDPVSDRFYSSLLGVISDEKLRASIQELHLRKTVVGRLSHAVYLLPWRSQPSCMLQDYSPERSSTPASGKHGTDLKSSLQGFVRRAKGEGNTARDLLHFRLTGYAAVNNVSYHFLREAYESHRAVIVCLHSSPRCKALRYQGYILLFDRSCNLLLSNVRIDGRNHAPFMYISYKSIRSVSYG